MQIFLSDFSFILSFYLLSLSGTSIGMEVNSLLINFLFGCVLNIVGQMSSFPAFTEGDLR